MSPSSETREAQKQRVISLCHLKCNIYSITSKLTIDLTLNYVKIFKFQNGSTKKLFYKQSLSLNVRPRVLKSPQSRKVGAEEKESGGGEKDMTEVEVLLEELVE